MHNKLKTSDILANSILHTASSSDNIAVIEALASVVVNNAKLMTSSDKSMDLQQSIIKISSLYKDAEKQLEDEKKLQVCKRVARRALSEKWQDNTNGAIKYHKSSEYPEWAKSEIPCAIIGDFLFYGFERA
jgi:cation transport regulator ChaB